MVVAAIVVFVLSAPVLLGAGYLFLLTLCSARNAPPPPVEPRLRFDFVVPAHNESVGIARTVESLLHVDYPPAMRRVLVVADNCSDDTAARAKAAGATVLVRQDANLRGKGYALNFAFERSLADGAADAVVVVDADTLVSPNLLRAFGARLAAGAQALQAEYGVLNPNASWRTRLMVIALAMFHGVRSRGRERLHVSCGLRGNGMSFTNEVIRAVPHEAFSLVEDLEYGIRLARAGYPVHYVEEAQVLGEMVSSEKASRSQRQRWEGGRMAMMKLHGLPLLREAVGRGDRVLVDLAMDLVVPPLTYLFGGSLLGLSVALALTAVGGPAVAFAVVPWALSVAMILAYVFRGVLISPKGAGAFLDLAGAPVYILWKIALSLSSLTKRGAKKNEAEWVRTTREDEDA